MRSRFKWVLTGILAVIMLCAGLFFLSPRETFTLTVQATLHVPADEERPGTEYRILPNQDGGISRGAHDAEFQKAAFHQGVLATGLGYGPASVRGSFSRTELKSRWDGIPLEADWPFEIALFNTTDGGSFRAYMDLEISTDRMDAKATFYVFYGNGAHPVIRTWEGRIGECIHLNCEL